MTIVVGYRAGNVGLSGLHLAVRTARSLGTSLTVATIVPKPWLTPSFARVDAEYEDWAVQLATESEDEARRFIQECGNGVHANYRHRASRSISGGLIEEIEDANAEMLVLGSLPSAGPGQVVIGATADWLLHGSPVPVAISPPEYRSHEGRFTRVSCAYDATEESLDVVRRCIEYAKRFGVPLRVLTFAVRRRTMYPPEIGLHAEDAVLQAWAQRAREIQAKLAVDGFVGENVALRVVTGQTWQQALESTDWQDGEILVVGTTPRGDLRRVFLGSRSSKIIRHSPVPVLVLPG